jgi:hypothetical protein
LGREIKDAEEALSRVKEYKAEYNKAYYEAKKLRGATSHTTDEDEEEAGGRE